MERTVVIPPKEELLRFMKEAIDEAKQGLKAGGIPIGSVLVKDGKVIGRGHNRRVQHKCPVTHAEIDCLRNAGRVGSYKNTILYSTLMPCAMCAGASVQFRVPIVVAGEDRTFPSSRTFMESKGITVVDLDLSECYEMMAKFAKDQPDLWSEDIGEL
jgi:cytosine/creatinine deaminase